ncbi:hypothetical protein ACLOJK_023203 [Asimina triloba]
MFSSPFIGIIQIIVQGKSKEGVAGALWISHGEWLLLSGRFMGKTSWPSAMPATSMVTMCVPTVEGDGDVGPPHDVDRWALTVQCCRRLKLWSRIDGLMRCDADIAAILNWTLAGAADERGGAGRSITGHDDGADAVLHHEDAGWI